MPSHSLVFPEAGSHGGIRRDPRGTAPGVGVTPPAWMKSGVLYCLYPRSFTPEGTLDAARRGLTAIRHELRADAIWLLPIHPIGLLGRKGSLGSPYAIRDFYAVNPDYGDGRDLKRLIAEAHALGLRVLIDLVINHAACDHPLATPGSTAFHRDRRGRPTRRYRDWTDVIDWDYSDPAVASYLLGAIEQWAGEYEVDGFRCDVAGMVPRSMWAQVRETLLRVRPDHYLLAEWDDPELHRVAFHASYDWELFRRLRRAVGGRFPAFRLAELVADRSARFPEGAEPLRFVENHDERRAALQFGAACAAVTVFTALAGGVWLLYNGQEVGARHRPSLFEREPISWDLPGAAAARRFHAGLAELHQRFRSFGAAEALPTPYPREMAAYRRRGPSGGSLLVLLNLGGRALPMPESLRDEVTAHRLEFLSRARMGTDPFEVPGRSVALFAPPAAVESGSFNTLS